MARAGGRVTEELAASDAVMRGVRNMVDEAIFARNGGPNPYEAPSTFSLVGDASAVLRRRGDAEDRAARERLDRSGLLTRAVTNTVTSDVLGALGVSSVPDWVARAVAIRQAPSEALIDALQVAPLLPGARPWVPTPAPPVAAGVQTAEKTDLTSRTITVAGDAISPTLIGRACNVSEQTMAWAGDSILLLITEDVVVGVASYLVAALAAASGGTPSTTLTAGLAAVEDAGWLPDLVVASRSAWGALVTDPATDTYAGCETVLGVPTANVAYVIARTGVWVQVSPVTQLTVAEPNIGGRAVSAMRFLVINVAPGAVAAVAAP